MVVLGEAFATVDLTVEANLTLKAEVRTENFMLPAIIAVPSMKYPDHLLLKVPKMCACPKRDVVSIDY